MKSLAHVICSDVANQDAMKPSFKAMISTRINRKYIETTVSGGLSIHSKNSKKFSRSERETVVTPMNCVKDIISNIVSSIMKPINPSWIPEKKTSRHERHKVTLDVRKKQSFLRRPYQQYIMKYILVTVMPCSS